MNPDQARQQDFLLDPNRWYIIYLKFVFEKGKFKKKRLKEKKTLIKYHQCCVCMHMHANALICSHMVLTYFLISD